MLSIRSSADMERALDGPMAPELRALLTARRDQLLDGEDLDLAQLAHLIVVQRDDTLAKIEAEAGLPLATNLIDGSKLEEDDFQPSFEWIDRRGGWIEAAIILNDDGFALALFVPDRIDIDPAILLLLA